jgi:hypothetical protein
MLLPIYQLMYLDIFIINQWMEDNLEIHLEEVHPEEIRRQNHLLIHLLCRNPSQGKGLEGCGPRGRPRSHFTCSQECKKCEGMNLHTHKWSPMLGIGAPKGLPNL